MRRLFEQTKFLPINHLVMRSRSFDKTPKFGLKPLSRKITPLVVVMGLLTSCTPSVPTQPNQTEPFGSSSPSTANRPKVVVTTTILCDMTRTIAVDTIDLTCLLKPEVDGHVYEPVPEDRKAIENAQLILYSGYDFELELVKLIKSTSNSAAKIAVGEKAVPKPLMGEEHHHGEAQEHSGEHASEQAKDEHSKHEDAHHEDHAKEQAEGQEKNDAENHALGGTAPDEKVPDPHVWQDARQGARMVAVIREQLTILVPAQANLYAKNGNGLETELLAIDQWIRSQIATIPATARKLVTTHDAMGYYSAAYRIPVEGALQGISTEEKPTAAQLKGLVDQVRSSNIPTIFAEVVVNPKLITSLAKEAKVKVAERQLYSDSLGESGSEADTYPKMLIANTRTIVEGLGGNYVSFKP